jgi:hypothetical protein
VRARRRCRCDGSSSAIWTERRGEPRDHPGVTWWGWRLPALLEAAAVLALGLVMLGIAIWEFNATE